MSRDLPVRLSLYRRLADLDTEEEIDNFAAELRDRFGVLPDEVRYLFKVAAIKAYCRRANVEKVDAGPKGAVIAFRDNSFAQPDRLVAFIRQHGQAARVRPDMKVVFFQDWETPEDRLTGTTDILRQLAHLAENKKAAYDKAAAGIAADGRYSRRLLRILELGRGLQRVLGGVHRGQPFVVLLVVADLD